MFSKVVVHPGGGLTLVTEDKGEMFVGPSPNDIHIEPGRYEGVKVSFSSIRVPNPQQRKVVSNR